MFWLNIKSLQDFLRLNTLEQQGLHSFSQLTSEDKNKYLENLIAKAQVDLIVKYACNNENFFLFCKQGKFSAEWEKFWSTYGIIITKNKNNALYKQNGIEPFELFLGIFFYAKSNECAHLLKKLYSELELSFLLKAMAYKSIHAFQRYHQHLYKLITNKSLSSETVKQILEKIILEIQGLVPAYRTYAYVMLVEAYVRYSIYMKTIGNLSSAQKAKEAALKACDKAENFFNRSEAEIFNASLGETLARSNTLGLENFAEIRTFIHQSTGAEESVSPNYNQCP